MEMKKLICLKKCVEMFDRKWKVNINHLKIFKVDEKDEIIEN